MYLYDKKSINKTDSNAPGRVYTNLFFLQVNKKKLGIYIISHKLNELKIQISSTIEIKKVHDYSILEVKYG